MAKRKRTKGQTMIYKTLYSNLKIEQHEPRRIDFLGIITLLKKT